MPKALHKKLAKQARKKKLKGEERDAFVYGGMRKTGWKPKKKKSRARKK